MSSLTVLSIDQSLTGLSVIFCTRISGPDGPLILAVDLINTPKGGGYGRTDAPTHCFIYIDDCYDNVSPIGWVGLKGSSS